MAHPVGAGSRLTIRVGSKALHVTAHGGYADWTMPVTPNHPATWSLSAS
jgi:hypothetical protein